MKPETVKCVTCKQDMPKERADLGFKTCIKCTPPRKKPKGVWDYPVNFHERKEGVGGLIVLD